MKFSYTLLKQFVPSLKDKAQAIETLTTYSFETKDGGGNVLEVDVPPNRYADAASHAGIAREIAAAMGKPLKLPSYAGVLAKASTHKSDFLISVENGTLCPRYTAAVFTDITVKASPLWMQRVLKDCGLRPINNVVDIMNYVMLEVGQPLHAFDADRLSGGRIVVRNAKEGESLVSIDGIRYRLSRTMLVIADGKIPQAIAGIKGGKEAEVSADTKRIVVESANFDPVSIYETSNQLHLVTDASNRFSRGLSPALALAGLRRVETLLKEIVGAKGGLIADVRSGNDTSHVIAVDVARINRFLGASFSEKQIESYLLRLGFSKQGKGKWRTPPFRIDVETHEDVAEELARMFGLNRLISRAPSVTLCPSEIDERIVMRGKARKLLVGFGFEEVYNYSMISEKQAEASHFGKICVELENPPSREFRYLRPSLIPGLLGNLGHNGKFFEEIRLFETGNVFSKNAGNIMERERLGIAFASKHEESFFVLKGVIESVLKGLGIVDIFFIPQDGNTTWGAEPSAELETSSLLSVVSGTRTVGYFGRIRSMSQGWNGSVGELDMKLLLELAEEEKEYQPISKYPSVMRDLSFVAGLETPIGEVMQAIQESNLKLIEDVDFIDEYGLDPERRALTFRIVFQAKDRTLTKEEVDREIVKLIGTLKRKFDLEIR